MLLISISLVSAANQSTNEPGQATLLATQFGIILFWF